MAARYLHHHAHEGPWRKLIAAEQPRLQDAIEPCPAEGLVELLAVVAAPIGLGLLFAQPGPQCSSPFHQDRLGETRFGLRQRVEPSDDTGHALPPETKGGKFSTAPRRQMP